MRAACLSVAGLGFTHGVFPSSSCTVDLGQVLGPIRPVGSVSASAGKSRLQVPHPSTGSGCVPGPWRVLLHPVLGTPLRVPLRAAPGSRPRHRVPSARSVHLPAIQIRSAKSFRQLRRCSLPLGSQPVGRSPSIGTSETYLHRRRTPASREKITSSSGGASAPMGG